MVRILFWYFAATIICRPGVCWPCATRLRASSTPFFALESLNGSCHRREMGGRPERDSRVANTKRARGDRASACPSVRDICCRLLRISRRHGHETVSLIKNTG